MYERFVAKLMIDEADSKFTVHPNAKLKGGISKRSRQIDVLIETQCNDSTTRRTIVDAKKSNRPITVKKVEEFEGMMRDVGAHHGIIVCPNGYSKSALRRAQDAITIRLVGLDELERVDLNSWDPCSDSSCGGLVLWDRTPALNLSGDVLIFATGKCDQCRGFNVWCWTCNEKSCLGNEDEYKCSCEGVWFWMTAKEFDSDDLEEKYGLSYYLYLIYGLGGIAEIDRKPIS